MKHLVRSAAAAGCAIVLSLAPGATSIAGSGSGHQLPSGGTKEHVAELDPLPGVDRGLRTQVTFRAAARVGPPDDASARPSYVPGKVIVRWRSGREPALRDLTRAGIPALGIERPDHADFAVLRIGAGDDAEEVARRLMAREDVQYAQAAYRVQARRLRPNDPMYSLQWNLPAIDLERAWDINPGASADVIVAVIDSGVAFRSGVYRYNARAFRFGGAVYPALGPTDVSFTTASDLGGDRFVSPRDFIWDDELPFDLDGHGTHVAGTIGQSTNNSAGVAGVAFNVRIMPVKVIDGEWDFIFSSPNEGTDDLVARGVRYAADNGAKVINMSIGRTGPPAPVIEEAVRYAVSRGAFLAISGGNSFDDGNPVEVISQIASRVDGAMSVAAVGRDLEHASYSSTGDYIEIAAPGGNFSNGGSPAMILQQTLDEDFVFTFERGPTRFAAPRFDVFAFEYFQGTSMAAPHVAGLAALLYHQGVDDPAAIEAVLKKFAVDRGPAGRDDEFGHGLISARSTLRGLGLAR